MSKKISCLLSATPFPLRPERALWVLLVTICLTAPMLAQTDDMPVPPPPKTVATEDRAALDAIVKPKDRAKRAIMLAEGRLKRAEELTTAQDFEAALIQLGNYQGIVTDTLKFLKPFKEQRLREPFRNLEVALRAYVPRIEGLRRQTPVAYGVHVRAIGEYTRDARTEALNAFFDDTVLVEEQARPGTTPDQTAVNNIGKP